MMNQCSKQTAKNSVEKDFFKLLNNANFGYDCQNNFDNCIFVSIFDELKEISYLKKYYNVFDNTSKFVLSKLVEKEIEKNFNDGMMKVQKHDPFYDIKLTTLNNKRKEDLEALQAFR